MILVQDADSEGSLAFDPSNAQQVAIAMRIAKIHKRRRISKSRRQELCGYLVDARNKRSRNPVGGGLSL